jgi:hypothetical protein
MVYRPKRSSVFGVRKLGDLTDREASRKAIGNQNLTPGRYDVNEEAKKGTQKSLSKIKAGKAETGGTETPVVINPEKPDAIGKTYN